MTSFLTDFHLRTGCKEQKKRVRNKRYNVVEFFSGIGSQAKALKNIGADIDVLNTCEWNIHACMAYERIHLNKADPIVFKGNKDELIATLINSGVSNDGRETMNRTSLQVIKESTLRAIYSSIQRTKNLVDISRVSGEDLNPYIDIMTYSFPCQDLSFVGAFHGYQQGIDRNANNRSCLLWQVERILLERKEKDLYLPHFLLMENVPALNSARHRKNFQEWQDQLIGLGYYNQQYVLNAKDFGIPQNRERLFMISVLTDGDMDIERDVRKYFADHNLESMEYRETLDIRRKKLSEILRTDYNNPTYMAEALESQPNDTVSRRKIWEDNVQLTDDFGNVRDDLVTSTLTTKQDRNPNSGNVHVEFNNGKAEFRYLTPRECFMLMGFSEADYEKIIKGNLDMKTNAEVFTRDNLIKMAGNSIAVNVLEQIFSQILELDQMLYI